MRLVSDLRSSNRGEITALAIVETVLSVAIYVGIAYWYDTVQHIVIAAALAPLWLLRTRGSVSRGLRWYAWLNSRKYGPNVQLNSVLHRLKSLWVPGGYLKRQSHFGWLLLTTFAIVIAIQLLAIIGVLVELVLAVVIRIAATFTSAARHPLVHFIAIRKNWKRLVLATDVGTLPEWLPGSNEDAYTRRTLIGDTVGLIHILLNREISWLQFAIVLPLFLPALVVLYIIPLLLRTAIKGVSILYTPLFLVINSDPINRTIDLGTRLVEMQHDNAAILKRAYALFAIASFVLTMFFSGLVIKAHEWISPESTPVFLLLAEYYFPPTLRAWQLASAINGAMFLYLSWIYAQRAARRLELGIWKPADVRAYVNKWVGVQMVLSIYSIMCAVAIFANFLLHHKFPERYWQWFPVVGT
jgi:hypothetical protein